MRRTLLVSLLVVVPSISFAFEYKDISNRYIDAPFSPAEAAGISILTSLNAIEGNPDGSFDADRTLNRAEFLKIVLLTKGETGVNIGDSDNCFPDVRSDTWYSAFVCFAKKQGIIAGYPDGLFHPERSVNYAEALKMLGELYNVKRSDDELPFYGDWWFVPYREGAIAAGVGLHGMDGQMEHLLTRGEMARLTAAYHMYSIGELDEYRAFERGETISSRSSSSISSGSSASSVSPAPQSSQRSDVGSISSLPSAPSFPSTSHFLVAGTVTPVLYDGFLQAVEDVRVQSVEVELYRKVISLDALILVDQNGIQIGTLSLDITDNTAKTKWHADFSTGSYVIPGNTPVRIGIVARVKSAADGAVSNELLKFTTVQIVTAGTRSNIAYYLTPTDINRPSHHTAFGRPTSIVTTLGGSASVQQGAQRRLGSFTMAAQLSNGSTLKAQSLTFEVQTLDAAFSNLKIGTDAVSQQSGCSTEQGNGTMFVICPIPESLQSLSSAPVAISVFGDISVSSAKQSGTVQLLHPVLTWTDGYSVFNWIEGDIPAESGPLVTVTK